MSAVRDQGPLHEGRDWLATHPAVAAALTHLDRLAVEADAIEASPAQLTARLETIFVRLGPARHAIAAALAELGIDAPAPITAALAEIEDLTQPARLPGAADLAQRLGRVARLLGNLGTDLCACEETWTS